MIVHPLFSVPSSPKSGRQERGLPRRHEVADFVPSHRNATKLFGPSAEPSAPRPSLHEPAKEQEGERKGNQGANDRQAGYDPTAKGRAVRARVTRRGRVSRGVIDYVLRDTFAKGAATERKPRGPEDLRDGGLLECAISAVVGRGRWVTRDFEGAGECIENIGQIRERLSAAECRVGETVALKVLASPVGASGAGP